MDYDTIVIGGGASGIFASIFAARNGRVLLVEKNENLGEKLKISGGGRCNIFNKEEDLKKLLANYGDSAKYLYSPFTKFGLFETEVFFKSLGIEVKVEDRKRAFPISERAVDVFVALQNEIVKRNVEVKTGCSVEKIIMTPPSLPLVRGGTTQIVGVKIKSDQKIYTAKKYILATGGYSHPETGSTGDGFKFLKSLNLGLKIVEPTPSLVPVSVSDEWVKELSGKTVENIKLTFFVDNIKKKVLRPHLASPYKGEEKTNRILFTHFGLSGPTILNTSKDISDWLKEGELTLCIDLFPQKDEGELDKYILNNFEANKNKTFKNVLNEIYPGNILEEIFAREEQNKLLAKQVNDVRVEERKSLIQTLKNLRINITGLMGFDKAIIADGGVEPEEVDFANMSLKKIPNLFVTGDMLNIARPSGGFSLQLCWTTGFVAGSSEVIQG